MVGAMASWRARCSMARDESREASASYGRLRPSGVCCVSASVGR
eukprot:CAMPEP_0184122092 /NCGR_PEP_ID=MMETSP0974-20121125/23308_1 /TAXON_ID=483370 /ORGANISM="non described non described, Strain CCMP2097" /LENGTH=43 /DNA_ID= /DNA_START= /DNA_END= /DNA_ORIENTATION=